MLFHITAKHDHTNCPRKDPDRSAVRKLVQASGQVKTIGAWIDGPSHTLFAIVESDSSLAIREACDGLMDIGPVEVRPVTDMVARQRAQ